MPKLIVLLVYLIGFVMLVAGEILSVLCGLLLKGVGFAYRQASGRHSTRISALGNCLLLLRKRQEKAEDIVLPVNPEQAATLEPVCEPSFQIAKIHTRKYEGGSVRVVLYQYEDQFKRTAWIPVRKGRRGKVACRFEMEPLAIQPITQAWQTTKSDLAVLKEKISEKRARKGNVEQEKTAPLVSAPAVKAELKPEPVATSAIQAEAKPAVTSIPNPITPMAIPTPTPPGEALSAMKLDRPVEWIGKVIDFGRAKREDVKKPYEAFRVKLVTELGIVEDVWGADLARSFADSGCQAGQRVHIRFVGKRPVPMPGQNGQTETREKNIYEVNLLAN